MHGEELQSIDFDLFMNGFIEACQVDTDIVTPYPSPLKPYSTNE
jgi:hypothetical protein